MKNRNIGKILLPLFLDAIVMSIAYFSGSFILNKIGISTGGGFFAVIPFLIIIKVLTHGIFGFYFDFQYGLIFQLFGALAGNIIIYLSVRFFFRIDIPFFLHLFAMLIDLGFVFLLRFVILKPEDSIEELNEKEYEEDYESDEKEYLPTTTEEYYNDLPNYDLLLDERNKSQGYDSLPDEEKALLNDPITSVDDNDLKKDHELEAKTRRKLNDLKLIEKKIQKKEQEFLKMEEQFLREKQRKKEEYSKLVMQTSNIMPKTVLKDNDNISEGIAETLEPSVSQEQQKMDKFVKDLEDLKNSLSSRAAIIKEQEDSIILKLHEITEKESYLNALTAMYKNRPYISDEELIRKTDEKISQRKKEKTSPYYQSRYKDETYKKRFMDGNIFLQENYSQRLETKPCINNKSQIYHSLNNEEQLQPFIKKEAIDIHEKDNNTIYTTPAQNITNEPSKKIKSQQSTLLNEDILRSQIKVAKQRATNQPSHIKNIVPSQNVKFVVKNPEVNLRPTPATKHKTLPFNYEASKASIKHQQETIQTQQIQTPKKTNTLPINKTKRLNEAAIAISKAKKLNEKKVPQKTKKEVTEITINEDGLPDFGFTPTAVQTDSCLEGIKLVHEPSELGSKSNKQKKLKKSYKDSFEISDLSDFINSLD